MAGQIEARCKEIKAEAQTDVMKVYDLAHLCSQALAESDKWVKAGEIEGVLEILAQFTRESGRNNSTKTTAEINSDYKALRVEAQSFLAWMTANFPNLNETVPVPVTVTITTSIGSGTGMAVTIDPIPALMTQVDGILAVYAP